MKKVHKFSLVLVVVILVAFVVGRVYLPLLASKFVRIEASYAEYPVETMITEADEIFLGRVTEISTTRWNQENGQYWVEGLPYHQVALSIIRPIVGERTDEIVLTVIGNNPLDSGQDIVMESDNSLRIGDEVIVFARETEFVWRKPERVPAIMFMGSPRTSIMIKEEDGLYHSINGDVYSLEDLQNAVEQKKEGSNSEGSG